MNDFICNLCLPYPHDRSDICNHKSARKFRFRYILDDLTFLLVDRHNDLHDDRGIFLNLKS